jgi:hypothetical protein
MFKWNEKSVKADVFDRRTQQITRGSYTPKEIVNDPIGKQTEVIVMACSKVLSELIEMKELEASRVSELMSKIQIKSDAQLELFSDIK